MIMQSKTYDTYDLVNFRMKNGRKVFTQGTVTKPGRGNGAGGRINLRLNIKNFMFWEKFNLFEILISETGGRKLKGPNWSRVADN